jgi:hypothetical protein
VLFLVQLHAQCQQLIDESLHMRGTLESKAKIRVMSLRCVAARGIAEHVKLWNDFCSKALVHRDAWRSNRRKTMHGAERYAATLEQYLNWKVANLDTEQRRVVDHVCKYKRTIEASQQVCIAETE